VTDALSAQTETVSAAATGPEAAPSPAPAPTPSPSPETVIAEARRRIDDLDARIIELVRERMDVSAEVQRARMGSGGRRLHLAREMEILRGYGDALGKPGTALAMTLLELCRGRV
jgi:chorismate mutase